MKRRFVEAHVRDGRARLVFEERRFPWSRWGLVEVYRVISPFWRRLSDGGLCTGYLGTWIDNHYDAAVIRGEVVDHDETEGGA